MYCKSVLLLVLADRVSSLTDARFVPPYAAEQLHSGHFLPGRADHAWRPRRLPRRGSAWWPHQRSPPLILAELPFAFESDDAGGGAPPDAAEADTEAEAEAALADAETLASPEEPQSVAGAQRRSARSVATLAAPAARGAAGEAMAPRGPAKLLLPTRPEVPLAAAAAPTSPPPAPQAEGPPAVRPGGAATAAVVASAARTRAVASSVTVTAAATNSGGVSAEAPTRLARRPVASEPLKARLHEATLAAADPADGEKADKAAEDGGKDEKKADESKGKDEKAAGKDEKASEKKEEAPKKDEKASEKKEEAPKKDEKASEKKEEAPKKDEKASEKKEEAPKKDEKTPSKKDDASGAADKAPKEATGKDDKTSEKKEDAKSTGKGNEKTPAKKASDAEEDKSSAASDGDTAADAGSEEEDGDKPSSEGSAAKPGPPAPAKDDKTQAAVPAGILPEGGAPAAAPPNKEDEADDVADAKTEAEVDAELRKAEKEEDQADSKRREAGLRHLGLQPGQEDTLHRVERLQERIEDETKSPALAELLGGMKMDMYMLREKISMLDKELGDGVKLEAEDPTESLVYPVSVCMQCILGLTAQYFIIFTATALWKAFSDAFGLGSGSLVEVALGGACETVFYAPMLCVLFLGMQLRATQISQGETGPPPTAEVAMQACAWSIFVQTVLVLAIPAFSGRAAEISEHGVKFDGLESRAVAGLLTLLRYVAMIGLYVGFSIVCVATWLMDTRTLGVKPVDLWDDPTTAETEYSPALSTAMECTMALTFLFFAVYIMHAVLFSILELSGGVGLPESGHDRPWARVWVEKSELCFRVCRCAVSLAPMVCILFMVARIRALEVEDHMVGKPPWWTEACFHVCAWAIAFQVLLVFAAKAAGIDPHADQAEVAGVTAGLARGPSRTALDDEEMDSPIAGMAMSDATAGEKAVVALRGVLIFIAYVATIGVVVGLFWMHDPAKPMKPLSPSMNCAILLACQYLTVYLGLYGVQVVAFTVTRERMQCLKLWVSIFRMAECTVKLCPMTAILCIGTSVRALHLSDYNGSPQCWSQDAMYMASIALLTQLLVVLGAGMLSPSVSVDPVSSTPKHDGVQYVPGRVFLDVVRFLSFVALYGGVIIICISVLTIRPETAACVRRGYEPLVQ